MCDWYSRPEIFSCTIINNFADCFGGGVGTQNGAGAIIRDCIIWENRMDQISSDAVVSYSDVQGGWPGERNIDADPLFVAGPLGDFYLSQTAAGQPADSPCVGAGSDTAENLGLNVYTTRTDQVGDAGIVDMGYQLSDRLPR